MSDEMTITPGAYDADNGTIEVTFEKGDFKHTRKINAVKDGTGTYDEAGTAARIDEVAAGVAVKMGLGVIRNENLPDPALEIPDAPEAEPETGDGA